MSALAERVVREALELDEEERADVAAAILDSLGALPQEPEDVWLAEIERRAERAILGESEGTPWDVVRDQLAASLKR
jgi:Putative addiction module component